MKRRRRGMSAKRLLPGLVAVALVVGGASAVAASSVSGAASGTGKPVIGTPVAVPVRPLAGQRFTVSFAVTRAGTGAPLLAGKMLCEPSIAGRVISHAESFKAGTARLSFVVPASAGNKLLQVELTVTAGKQSATKVTTFKVQTPAVPSLAADTIFFGGTVLTMDPARPRAEAVAVRGDRIVAVGPQVAVLRLRGTKTRMIDLGGRTLLPGFNDAHAHWVVSAGGEEGMNAALRGGYTSISELFANEVQLNPLLALSAARKLRIRVNVYLPVNYDQEQKFGIWFGQYKQGQVIGPHLRMGGAKLFIDPVNPQQMLLSRPHSDQPGYHGEAFWTQRELNAIVKQVTDGGWQIATHTMGDAGLDMILTAYKQALPGPDNGRRFRIEHLGIVRDDQIPVLKQYGILGVIQYPFFTSRDADWVSVKNVGAERMPWVSRWADLIAAGVSLVGSTDTPATPRPGEKLLTTAMQAVSQVVTRVGLPGDEPLTPLPWMLAQRLTVEQALQRLTAAGAYATFEEQTKGTISQQKLADLVVLDRNPLATPSSNLRNIKVLATIVGGHAEYCAAGAARLCP